MGPDLVVVFSPSLNGLPGIRQVDEPMLVEAFVPEFPIETLHVGILDRLARFDEAEPDAGPLRPKEHGLTGQFRAVVHDDLFRQTAPVGQFVEEAGQAVAGDRGVDDLPRTFPGKIIDDIQHPEPPVIP